MFRNAFLNNTALAASLKSVLSSQLFLHLSSHLIFPSKMLSFQWIFLIGGPLPSDYCFHHNIFFMLVKALYRGKTQGRELTRHEGFLRVTRFWGVQIVFVYQRNQHGFARFIYYSIIHVLIVWRARFLVFRLRTLRQPPKSNFSLKFSAKHPSSLAYVTPKRYGFRVNVKQ